MVSMGEAPDGAVWDVWRVLMVRPQYQLAMVHLGASKWRLVAIMILQSVFQEDSRCTPFKYLS